MERKDVLLQLIRLSADLNEIGAQLAGFGWDSEPVAVLTRHDIIDVLRRYASGELNASTVERWASLIECREDISYQPGHEETILDGIYNLANPLLVGPLPGVLADITARLNR